MEFNKTWNPNIRGSCSLRNEKTETSCGRPTSLLATSGVFITLIYKFLRWKSFLKTAEKGQQTKKTGLRK